MGEVWKAEDLELTRTVAIKFITQTLIEDSQSKEPIAHEARAAAAINHPNIATIYEIGEDAGRFFIVMEYVEGQTLQSLIEQGPLELVEALDVAIQIAEALGAANKRGLIHCDIKDSNVMVTPGGVAKVLDFGLARTKSDLSSGPLAGERPERAVRPAQALRDLNEGVPAGTERALAGTLHYLAPERIRGEQVNVQTDIFSLGGLLYQMLTARHPFDGDSRASVIKAILDTEPLPLAAYRDDVSLELECTIRKALEKDRQERYQSADAMIADLKAVRASVQIKGFQVARMSSLISSDAREQPEPREILAFPSRSKVRAFVWRMRKWIAGAGAIALMAAAVDFFFLQHQGVGWSRGFALSILALLCFAAAYAAGRGRSIGSSQSTANVGAFRGLLPFQEADRDRFYGRDVDTASVFGMIAHEQFHFGVLFGESGSGKTSLLRAGVLPKLWEAGFLPVYCRSYKDPLAALLEECRRQSQVERSETESPADYLKRVSIELCAGIVVVCDQFEEFFVNFKTKRDREPFISFVAEHQDSAAGPVKFLFSMRSDFLYLVSSEFEGRVPEPLLSSRLYHLRNFDEDRAEEIIEKSARRAGLPFEPELVHQVAHDLSNAGTVLPSELQIVGERLQSKRIYTVQEYRRAGGKEPLVHSFLEDVIQASGDQESAQLLLRCLISDENTRLTLSIDEIARRTQRSRQTTERILSLFVGARLVREVQEDDPWRYELMHEYLIEKINQITGRVMDATQRANRLFKQYLSNHAVDKRTRIPISKLWFIRRYSDVQRGKRERELLRKSLSVGLAKAGALALLLASAATVAAAALSVSEDWDGVRLNGGHTAAVRRAVFSPDGKLLASCGEDKKVIVWDFAKRERLAIFAHHEDIVTAVGFSTDGKWLATSSKDKTVMVWDATTLERVSVLRRHTSEVHDLAFSTDGRFLVSMGVAETISWSVGSFETVVEIPLSMGTDFAFLPHSSKLISNRVLGEIAFFDAATGTFESHRVAQILGGYAAISPDGKTRMCINGEGIVQFADIERLKVLNSFEAHKDNGRSVAFSPDGKLAASASENVILWDARTRTKIATLEHESLVWSVSFSPDGRWLVSTHTDGAILVWDVAERQRVANLNEHSGAVYAVAYSRDGERIASSSEDSSVIIWNAATGQKEAVLIGHKSKANGVVFLPDGEHVISCGFQDPLILWDIARGEALRSFASPNTDMHGSNGFAVSPDGRWLATSNGVFDVSDGRVVCYFPDKSKNDQTDDDWLKASSQIYGIAFSRDGRLLTCASAFEGHIGLLDTRSWGVIAHAQATDSLFISLSFSPDGKLLATGDDYGKVELWSVSPLERIAVIGRHAARVKAVAFSPDGKEIVSASDDKTIALWNVGSRSLAARIGTHAAPVRSVAFSPDGKHIVSGEHDKSVRVHTRHRVLWGKRLD